MMRARRRLRRLSVPGAIICLLLMSALLRIGGIAGMAQALGHDPGDGDAAPSAAAAEGTSALLDAFRARESRLEAREARVTDHEQALARASAEVEDRLAALQAAEQALAAMVALADRAAADDLARLTAVYENMRPQEAAALFETMDPAFGAGFLGLMDPVAAAAIMGRLTPATAYSISAVLAGRNSSAPDH
ncbi:MAG: hypothetical protein H3C51_02545 [Rubellimicrobium sp.]|nr:hypothetical protein [Rubellimicrobium sp.]